MFDHLFTDAQRRARDQARAFVKDTPRELILDMDAEKVRFPKEWLREAARRGLLGVRHPVKWGGQGLDWVASCAVSEEIGSLSYELACVFGVGGDLVCDAIIAHGTDEQTARYVKPLLAGEIFAAECLTEPRGGSDFFGATCTAEDKGDHFLLNGQKRFIVGGEGADYFLLYARTNPDRNAPLQQSISAFIVDRSPGVEVKYVYGLMGCRGGGKVVHNSMQVCGGIGYTNVLPIERIHRDVRLASIWTGTNEVMSMIVAHEWYREARAAIQARPTPPTPQRRTRATNSFTSNPAIAHDNGSPQLAIRSAHTRGRALFHWVASLSIAPMPAREGDWTWKSLPS